MKGTEAGVDDDEFDRGGDDALDVGSRRWAIGLDVVDAFELVVCGTETDEQPAGPFRTALEVKDPDMAAGTGRLERNRQYDKRLQALRRSAFKTCRLPM